MDYETISFAFDIGTNSIGWSVFALDERGRPLKIIASGVRIFSGNTKGRTRARPAEERRMARSASRRRDRSLRRRKVFLRELVAIGLLPQGKRDYQDLIRSGFDRKGCDHLSIDDPHVLRARALHEKLTPWQLGRAIFHLSRKRGRPAKQACVSQATDETAGQVLALRRVSRLPVRQRPGAFGPSGNSYPEDLKGRQAAETEFVRIWNCQCERGNALLTKEAFEKLFAILFSERSAGKSAPGIRGQDSLPQSDCRTETDVPRALADREHTRRVPERDGSKCCEKRPVNGQPSAGKTYTELPPYQEILKAQFEGAFSSTGRIAKDVVHVGLNQLRRVCNAMIRRFGKPHHIVVESMRCPAPRGEARRSWHGERARRQMVNAELDSQFEKLLENNPQISDTPHNRLKFRLWLELNPQSPNLRRCIYSGSVIAVDQLFSTTVEIDHITPYSIVRSNRRDNLTVCLATANRQKGARRPAACAEWVDDYAGIEHRAAILPAEKARRFDPANDDFGNCETDFKPGQLADTRRLAKFSRAYLACLFEEGGTGNARKILCVPGRVTAVLRHAWNLDNVFSAAGKEQPVFGKNRNDYRQHAVDAMILGATPKELVTRPDWAERITASVPSPPWKGYPGDARRLAGGIIVSHKADHGRASGSTAPGKSTSFGRLHNDSAYGLTGEVVPNGKPVIVRRKPFNSLRPNDLNHIRDDHLRERLIAFTDGTSGREFASRLIAFSREDAFYRGIRRVRLTEVADVIAVRDGKGRAVKAYKGNSNFRFDVWQLQNGKWVSEVVTMFDAHQAEWTSAIRAAHHNPKKVMSLKQQDMIAIDGADGDPRILRVVKFSRDGRICLAPHNEAGDLKRRDANRSDPFRYITMVAGSLKTAGARQIRVDELGNVSDPGSLSSC